MPKAKIIHKCPVSTCRYTSNRIQNVNRHARAFHCPSSKIQNCCGTYFLSLHDYTEHRKSFHVVSNGITSYKCQICGLNTNSKSAHEKHLRIHTKIHPYKCSYCNYSSPQRSNVMRHLPKHLKKEGVAAYCITDLSQPGTDPGASAASNLCLPSTSNGLTFSMSWEDAQSGSLTMDQSVYQQQQQQLMGEFSSSATASQTFSTSQGSNFTFGGFPKNNIQDFIDNFIPTLENLPQTSSTNEMFPDLDETLSAYESPTYSNEVSGSNAVSPTATGDPLTSEEQIDNVKMENYDFNGFLDNEHGACVMVKLESADQEPSEMCDSGIPITLKSKQAVDKSSSWQPSDQQTADDMLNDLMHEISYTNPSTSSDNWDHILNELHPTESYMESQCNLDGPLATSTPIKTTPPVKLDESEWPDNQEFKTLSIPDTISVDPSTLPQVETSDGQNVGATYIEL